MVHDKHNFFQHYRLPAFPSREWLSDLFFGEQVQISQASLLPVLSTDALRNIRNVKFLQLNYMKFYGSYEHFPKNLIWLCWHGFSLRSIPKHLCLEKLVVLDLSKSCLVDAWKGKLGHRFLQSDASTPSIITSLSLKLLFPSRFSARKAPRFTLPHSLTRLDLSETPIRFLPESIKDLSPLVALTLRNCKMLQTLPELPSNLSSLDVSSSYLLQSVPNLIPWTVVYDCDQLADIQDWDEARINPKG
ncbi:LEUCINE-RICH REPEAT-CONTAINING PROTEIN [Salix purpurea]|uniref:LEUCINE-RICH REPEAT-CONTAINING PROTEIN n=1 Tax=Salix purpurea TaxID=77065 RepID=A0A9Q0WN87_SALPP|nr:LEUCINE-RICH REPEAT-CONTAINING PROTEIN [Salix purpurea]